MIANALRADIDRCATQMRESNALFRKAEDGTFTPAHLNAYLRNIHRLVWYTPFFLRRARDGANHLGDRQLAEHYETKCGEEQGHDIWAERDIAGLSSLPLNPDVTPAMKALLDYIREIIDRDPCLYLAYMLFAEYITVIVGDEWLSLLETKCGIPRVAVSVIDKHVELDREHVEEALDRIDELVGDPRKLPDMRSVVLSTFALFDRFCAEVTSEYSSATWVAADAEQQTSAA